VPQLGSTRGGTLGIGILITVFIAAGNGASKPAGRRRAGGADRLGCPDRAGVDVVLAVIWPQGELAGIAEPA
jgi:hypothetical protein